MSTTKTDFLTIRLERETSQRLQELADREDRPKSSVVRLAIREYLDHEEWYDHNERGVNGS
jgi:predicted transcriptional regulator